MITERMAATKTRPRWIRSRRVDLPTVVTVNSVNRSPVFELRIVQYYKILLQKSENINNTIRHIIRYWTGIKISIIIRY